MWKYFYSAATPQWLEMVLWHIKRLYYNFEENLSLEGHKNCKTGSRVTAVLLNGWIFPIGQSGEATRWRVCYQRGLPRLVSLLLHHCENLAPPFEQTNCSTPTSGASRLLMWTNRANCTNAYLDFSIWSLLHFPGTFAQIMKIALKFCPIFANLQI